MDLMADCAAAYGDLGPDVPWPRVMALAARTMRYHLRQTLATMTGARMMFADPPVAFGLVREAFPGFKPPRPKFIVTAAETARHQAGQRIIKP